MGDHEVDEEKKGGAGRLFEEIMAENAPCLKNNMDLQILGDQ